MEFAKTMEIKKRMCFVYNCNACPLDRENNGKSEHCGDFIVNYPQQAEQILIEWDKAHPIKTFLSDFLEKYPNAPLDDNGVPTDVCPHFLGHIEPEKCENIDQSECLACWSRPLEVEE